MARPDGDATRDSPDVAVQVTLSPERRQRFGRRDQRQLHRIVEVWVRGAEDPPHRASNGSLELGEARLRCVRVEGIGRDVAAVSTGRHRWAEPPPRACDENKEPVALSQPRQNLEHSREIHDKPDVDKSVRRALLRGLSYPKPWSDTGASALNGRSRPCLEQ
jgi:hypothetical protein